ncbi:MAG TPA: hypothetical protein PKN36_07145 [bacterium]|nr:hypothetical protein [bacterium]
MKKKKIKKELLHLSIFINFVIFFYLVKLMPAFAYPGISRFLGNLSFLMMGSTRKKVVKNLKIAYGETFDRKERHRIGREIFSNIILSFCELVGTTKIDDRKIIDMAVIEGEDKLRTALKSGSGVIGACSHMGNFPLLEMVLVKKGYPANVIVKNPTAIHLAKFCDKLAREAGVPYISKKDVRITIKEAQNWITKSRGILSFYLDQHAGNGVTVNFFDRAVFAPTGAAVFARKYDCLTLGVFSHRMKNGRHRIIIEGPYPLKKTNNAEEDIRENTAYFMKRVEHYVKLYPEQWFSWLHRRFR